MNSLNTIDVYKPMYVNITTSILNGSHVTDHPCDHDNVTSRILNDLNDRHAIFLLPVIVFVAILMLLGGFGNTLVC